MVGQSDWLPMMIATDLAAMHALVSRTGRKKAPYRGTPSREASGYDPLTMSAHRSGNSCGGDDGEGEPGQGKGGARARANPRAGLAARPRPSRNVQRAARAQCPVRAGGAAGRG